MSLQMIIPTSPLRPSSPDIVMVGLMGTFFASERKIVAVTNNRNHENISDHAAQEHHLYRPRQ